MRSGRCGTMVRSVCGVLKCGVLIVLAAACTDTLGFDRYKLTCSPGETRPCHPGASYMGVCRDGVQVCLGDGSGFSPTCEGEVLPTQEDCATPEDEDCDGNPGCACDPGETRACYTGAAGTEGVGICSGGVQTCPQDGSGFLPACEGEVLPDVEDCASAQDEDCDGAPACGDFVWQKALGGPGDDRIDFIRTDHQGALFVVGSFEGKLYLDGILLSQVPTDPACSNEPRVIKTFDEL